MKEVNIINPIRFLVCFMLQLLALYLTRERVSIANQQRVLELGAGTGLAGIVAALLMTSCHGGTSQPVAVTLTDNQEEVLKILQRNIDINFPLVHDGTRE